MAMIRIADRALGNGEPPFLILEVGINHNGELDRARAMVRMAKQLGADAVKFQTFKADEFVGDPAPTYTYRSQGRQVTESMLEMFRRYELTRDGWFAIKRECDEQGILFLSTPQNRGDLELLLELGVPAIKVGSDDFNNVPLLREYAGAGLPMLVSCGMADLAEVRQALQAVGTLQGHPTVLLLCTSQYPTPPQDVNLLKLSTLSLAFPMAVMGFSDHTQGPLASSLAVALGAHVFEKHFTLDHELPGPDHWFSEDPVGAKTWIASIRTAHTMMGSGQVCPTAAELEMRTLARRSATALRDIEAGQLLSTANIGLRRPGNGLPPALLDTILGSRAAVPIKKGALLKPGDFNHGTE